MRFSRLFCVCAVAVIATMAIQYAADAAIVSEGDVQYNVGSNLEIANNADGSLTITPPDSLSVDDIFIAEQSSSGSAFHGALTVDSTSLSMNGSSFFVGREGNGTVNIENGGSLGTSQFQDRFVQLIVGRSTAGAGAINVRGAGSELHLPGGEASVGGGSVGSLLIEDGGQALLQTLSIGGYDFGESAPGIGTTTIRSNGSELEVREGLSVGGLGIGELRVEDGGLLRGGTRFGSFAAIGNSQFSDDSIGSGIATVDGVGSRWIQQGGLAVGGTGSGNLSITNGGVVSSGVGVIGGDFNFNNSSNQAGIVTLDGAGSQWNVSNMRLGLYGTGQILLSDGARLINSNTEFFSDGSSSGEDTVIGGEVGSFGRLVVDGATTQWIDNSQQLAIGARGTGELVIQNGAVVTNAAVSLGDLSQGRGEVQVTGNGSRWQVGQLSIGGQIGSGKVSITEGAAVQFSSFNQAMSISSNGELVLDDGALLGVGLDSREVRNQGRISGSGNVHVRIENRLGGEIRVGSHDRLLLYQSLQNQQGRIEIQGGELEVRGGFVNESPSTVILEGGTLRIVDPIFGGPGPINSGTFLVASGNNRVFGDIQNTNSGQIILSGNSQTTFYDDIQNEGSINVSTGSVATFFGEVSGNGVGGGGTIFLEGNVSPGFSPGTMEFGGDVVLGDFNKLNIEVGNVASDMLEIVGDATLGGELILSALSGFEGDTSVEILSAASILGTFDKVPDMGEQLGFGVAFGGITYLEDSVVIDLLQGTADFDMDDDVDSADLDIWSAGYGTGTSLASGDAERDGDVDGGDFLSWQRQLTGATPPAAAQAVPEPSCFSLVALASTALLGFCRR